MLAWVRQHWQRLLVLALCIALPLLLFGEIADDVHEHEQFVWETPLIQAVRATAPPGFGTLALVLSWVGSATGMVPVVLVLGLLLWRKSHTMARFFLLSVGGAMLLNLVFKAFFDRARPDILNKLWTENDSSFPSGHATMAMALVAALVALYWRTPWRAPLAVGGLLYAFLMGAARVYVGVHYPTDVLAGWAAGLAWVAGVAFIYWPRLRRAQDHARTPGQFEEPGDPAPAGPPGST